MNSALPREDATSLSKLKLDGITLKPALRPESTLTCLNRKLDELVLSLALSKVRAFGLGSDRL